MGGYSTLLKLDRKFQEKILDNLDRVNEHLLPVAATADGDGRGDGDGNANANAGLAANDNRKYLSLMSTTFLGTSLK